MRGFAFLFAAVASVVVQGAAAADLAPLTAQERGLITTALQDCAAPTTAPSGAVSDEALRALLVRYATAQLGLRVRPSDVDLLWAIAPPLRQVEAEIAQARGAGRLDTWLQALTPAAPAYRALASARCRYRRIVEGGGWLSLQSKPDLKPGAAGSGVAELRRRLTLEGYLADPGGEAFDPALKEAVAAFQRQHDLEPDGVVGPGTRDALNVPAEQRLQQIDATMERWRWIRALPADRLEVNSAAAEAALYRDDAPLLTMRTVVGDLRHHTPMFASRLDSIVLNPPWNVPSSIASRELWPKERARPGYLARNGFSVVDGALRQAPGPGNALGRIKFDFPSPFGVYLHDTPGRSAFARSDRALSHGCIRLEKPRELAAILLEPQGWTTNRIDAAIETGTTQRIALRDRLPLFVMYLTVTPLADGNVQFHPDRYGWDAKLAEALSRAAAAPGLQVLADTDCATARTSGPAA